ncbi:hypothetical protein C8J56DRAFT_983558 [Mycena floridula]|nr:hypothetical protein C8J56DRAFT_983558 [Mycena floridula]
MPDSILDSPSPAVVLERSFFWGMMFGMALWGVDFFMYIYTIRLFKISKVSSDKTKKAYIIYGGLIFALMSMATFIDAVFMEFMWIDHRSAPGGPLGYLAANETLWWQVMGTLASQLTNFMADGLLLYRCYIIWNSNPRVIVLPSMIFITSIAMAMLMLVQSALPDSGFFRSKTVNYSVAWISSSVSLNILVTCTITFRILAVRKSLKQKFMAESHGNTAAMEVYTSTVAILVESALPFSIIGLIAASTYGKNLNVGSAFVFIWGAFAGLSPQFIIFRVAEGRAWTRDVAQSALNYSTMEFKLSTTQIATVSESRPEYGVPSQVEKSVVSLGKI